MTRLRKELFGLAPLWAVALLLGITPSFFPAPHDPALWLGAYGVGCALLSTAVFGKEISGGTLSLLLVQPIPRLRLLVEKATPAFLGSILLGIVCGVQLSLRQVEPPDRFLVAISTLLVPFCCLGPGVFLSLLLRQTLGAFWLTLLLPALLMTILEVVRNALGMSKHVDPGSVITMLSLYGAAGAWLAWRYFLRIQDYESPALSFSWGLERRAADSVRPVHRRTRTVVVALLKKELSLQTFNMVLAVSLLLLYGLFALVGDRLIVPGTNVPIGKDLVYFCWNFLPFSIGALPIAWERRLGILEWQQVQPISRLRQWLIKSGVAYALSLLAAMTALALFGSKTLDLFHLFSFGTGWSLPLIFLFCTTLGLYVSSRAASYLTALSLVLVLAFVLFGLLSLGIWSLWRLGFQTTDLSPALLILLGWLCWIAALAWLSWRNYAAIRMDRRINLLNVWVGLATVVAWFVSGHFIYNRVWERWAWSEPPPGPSIAVEGVMPSIRAGAAVLAPNGSLWIMNERKDFASLERVPGTNRWTQVRSSGPLTFGLNADGALWVLRGGWWSKERDPEPRPVQTEHRWARIELSGGYDRKRDPNVRFVGIDAEGVLWRGKMDITNQPSDLVLERPEVPPEIRWKDVILSGVLGFALSEEGACWVWGDWREIHQPTPVPVRPEEKWNRFMSQGQGQLLLIERADGTLWTPNYGQGKSLPLPLIELGPRHRWQRLAFSDGPLIVALRDDGTLWESGSFKFSWGQAGVDNYAEKSFRRLSDRSDWMSVSMWGDVSLGLTADGTLWLWGRNELPDREPPRLLPYGRIPKPIASLK